MVMDVVVADKIKLMEEEKDGPSKAICSGQSCSRYSMSRTCGPRDMFSWLSLKIRDNKDQQENLSVQ
jgi:hypothetical protein